MSLEYGAGLKNVELVSSVGDDSFGEWEPEWCGEECVFALEEKLKWDCVAMDFRCWKYVSVGVSCCVLLVCGDACIPTGGREAGQAVWFERPRAMKEQYREARCGVHSGAERRRARVAHHEEDP